MLSEQDGPARTFTTPCSGTLPRFWLLGRVAVLAGALLTMFAPLPGMTRARPPTASRESTINPAHAVITVAGSVCRSVLVLPVLTVAGLVVGDATCTGLFGAAGSIQYVLPV